MSRLLILATLSAITIILGAFIESKDNEIKREQNDIQSKEDSVKIEIRTYESVVVAKTELGSGSYDALSNLGFRRLAGYIFGNNSRSEEIAMTSPVMMDLNPKSSTMYFFMPEGQTLENLPEPNSEEVLLEELSTGKMAVIQFGGWASDEKIELYKNKLIDYLEKENIAHTGQFYFMGYNAPFDISNRKNEVAVVLN